MLGAGGQMSSTGQLVEAADSFKEGQGDEENHEFYKTFLSHWFQWVFEKPIDFHGFLENPLVSPGFSKILRFSS